MLALKLAELYADLTIRTNRYDATLKKIKSSAENVSLKPIEFKVDTVKLDAAYATIKAFRSTLASPISVRVNGSGGGGGRSGAGSVQRQTYAAQDSAARASARTAIAAAREAATIARNEARASAGVSKQAYSDEAKASRAAAVAAIRDAREKATAARNEARNTAAVNKQFLADEAKASRAAAMDAIRDARDKATIARNEARNTASVDKQALADEARASRAAAQAAIRDAREKAQVARNEAKNTDRVNRQLYADEVKFAKQAARDVIAAEKLKTKAIRDAAKAQTHEMALKTRHARDFARGLSMGTGNPYMGMGGPATMAGFALASGATASVKKFAEVEKQLAEIQRVSGMSADETKRLWDNLTGIGQTQPGVSIAELLNAAEQGGRQGISGVGGLTSFAAGIAQTHNAAGGGMPIDQMTEAMGKMLNVFELGPDKIKAIGSSLVAVDNKSIASMADLLDVTTRLSGAAHAAKISAPAAIAFAGNLKNAGLSNEVAGTFASQLFMKLATNREKFAKQLGIPVDQFEAMYKRSPIEAATASMKKLHEMKDPIEGLDSVKDLKMTGARSGGALLQLSTQVEKIGEMANVSSKAFETLAPLMEADAIKADLISSEYLKLENSATTLAVSLGTVLVPALRGVIDVLNESVQTLNWLAGHGDGTANIGGGSASAGLGEVFKKATKEGAKKGVLAAGDTIETGVALKIMDGPLGSGDNRMMKPGEKGTEKKPDRFKPYAGHFGQYGSGIEAGQALQDRLLNQKNEEVDQLKQVNANLVGVREEFKKWKVGTQPVLAGP